MLVMPRDLRILKAIDRYGLLTTKQIHEICFVGVATRTMLRRLRMLRNKKYITQHTGLARGQLVWTLGVTGVKQQVAGTALTLNKNSLEHDVQVSQIRVTLDRAKLGSNWQSSYSLRQSASENIAPSDRVNNQIPDALFTVRTLHGMKTVALEVELVAKSKLRYRKVIQQYADNDKIDYIWYIVSNPRVGMLIHELADKYVSTLNKQKFIYSHLQDVLKLPQESTVHLNESKMRLDRLWHFPKQDLLQKENNNLPTAKPTV